MSFRLPSLDLLLRCLLLLTLCLDGRLTAWSATLTAFDTPGEVTVIVVDPAQTVTDAGDCDKTADGSFGGSHDDCDCSKGSCGCVCFLSVAAILSVAPALATYAALAHPVAWSAPHVPPSMRTRVFRPPIA